MNVPVDENQAPLAGIRILEFSGLGPTPFGTMLLADLGAQVLRIERHGAVNPLGGDPRYDFIYRGRPSVALDVRSPEGRGILLDLAKQADVLIEGFRPGVMERLGLGPDELTAANERLIYARMSGWGQEGPLAQKAGHDLNYLAMSGGLHPIGPFDGPPTPPLNLVGNLGGGGTFLAMGIMAAIIERSRSGKGQILDVAMLDGISVLLTQLSGWMQMGQWNRGRGGSLLDGSAYFYRCYETQDARYIAVGALEKQFHDAFITGLGLRPEDFPRHLDPAHWKSRSEVVSQVMASKSRDQWVAKFEEFDACVSPVLSLEEATSHPANIARGVHKISARSFQPRPAPRFSRSEITDPGETVGEESLEDALRNWSLEKSLAAKLVQASNPDR
ncbi:CoA transferase [Altererythrobacter sp. BO-6]|uniref:CaiB/BaiF CoA transferase family protein n=1 Tax=Altererythrobacter sp. BO-6 TaxID=2604537 RepID=UPI0013E193CA|nr:CaiB/BaiF CoA-transferase family protein [Altererythrobacter sp. BO-6]QIG54763.1 CoA transferase [Altererythrobacter sp. BO-6]